MTAVFSQRGCKPLFSFPGYYLKVYFSSYVRAFILILDMGVKSLIMLAPIKAFIA